MRVSFGDVFIRPQPQSDGTYPQGTIVTLVVSAPGSVAWTAVDGSLDKQATVVMDSDRSVGVLVSSTAAAALPTPTPLLTATPGPTATPTPTPPSQSSQFTVNKTEDTNDGVCDSDCSLREAIGAAQSGDTVNIPAGTYTLTLGTEIIVVTGMALSGAGASTTVIQAATGAGLANARVFSIQAYPVTDPVIISGLTIRFGNDQSGFGGGGILVGTRRELTLIKTVVSNNRSRSGGGARNDGTLTLNNTTFTSNEGTAFNGGILGGDLVITNSTISNNSGSGISIERDETGTISNSTLSGNSALYGGAIFIRGGTLQITNSTVTSNSASASGAGIYSDGGNITLTNTILANSGSGVNCAGNIISQGHNLVSDGSCGFGVSGDISNTDPLLAPLQDNGGPTFTHALLDGSPAIDAGDNAACPATDQRGTTRPQGAACDIGAFEK